MKKIFNGLMLLILIVATTLSCSNDDNDDDNSTQDGQLIAMIDGNEFVAADINVAANFINGNFGITALNTNTNEFIAVTVSNGGEGTFDLGPDSTTNSTGTYSINGENAYLSAYEGGSGTITITDLDIENELASGTFEFTATRETTIGVIETVVISGGVFTNVPLQTQIPGDPNNSLTVDKDGTAYNADAVNAIKVVYAGNTIHSIAAINNTTGETLGIYLGSDIQTGTFDFESMPLPGAIVGQYSCNSCPTQYVSTSGSITISAYNEAEGTVTGTFNFVAEDFSGQDPTVYTFTNGTFDVTFIE